LRVSLILLALSSGILTFASPDALPLLPTFIAYMLKIKPEGNFKTSLTRAIVITLISYYDIFNIAFFVIYYDYSIYDS